MMVLLLGIAYLAYAYHVGATEPGTSQYPERSISVDRRSRRPGNVLLGKHCFDSAGAVPVGEYLVCRLPATLPRCGGGRLSAALVHHPRAATGLFGGHLGARVLVWSAADRVRRHH